MDKKVWTKPEVSVVEFEANEYVSACGNPTGPGYLLMSIAADQDAPLIDHNTTQANTFLFDYSSNPPTLNTQGYLDAVAQYGANQDGYNGSASYPDQILAFGTNDYVWDDGCWETGHVHNASSTEYDGWYAPAVEGGFTSVATDAWTRVKIWFQEVTSGSGSPIHAAAHSA